MADTTPGQLRAFAYVNADKASLYRAVMRAFLDAKARFGLHLRPQEVVSALGAAPLSERAELPAVEAALQQLCDWGNLEAHPDNAEVATPEEFNRPRYLFQLTARGEAAERAIAAYDEILRRPGELQVAALSDIRALLGELTQLLAEEAPDAGKAHRTLAALRTRFEELTARAQSFMSSLQRTIDLHGISVEAFLAYKSTLIDYLERFIGELTIAQVEIAALLERVDEERIDRLLAAAAARDLSDALAATDDEQAAALDGWRQRWTGLCSWFVRRPGAPAQADVLRARARSAIPALLGAVAGINERRSTRSDRAADLRALARWFAEAPSDRDAHRLWRAAFGLAPARHLRVDDATLDEREAAPVAPGTSWLDAPPLRIAPRLRAVGRLGPRGAPVGVIDRSAEKALLAALTRAEGEQIIAAQQRLATGMRMRLSEIGELDSRAFQLFLDLLGEALAGKVRADDVVETLSIDGALLVTLAPTDDERTAAIRTTDGTFAGPDHFVTIRDAFDDDESMPGRSDRATVGMGAGR